MMKSFFLFILQLGFIFSYSFSQEIRIGKLIGTIVDRVSQEPLLGANIILLGTNLGASVGEDGSFTIEKIPVGTYNVKISMLGYESQIKSDITISFTKPTILSVGLDVTSVQFQDEVVVEGSYFYKPNETPTSLQAMGFEEIRRAPGAAGDISRMIQNMPGVVQTTDSRNDLIVRGGSPAENLNIVDGFEIPNINHFGTQGMSGGPIGLLQTEFISEANFLSGGFPAMYGDKLSSVMDIRFRQGSAENLTGAFDLSMAGAGLLLEGPISKQTTFLTSARMSYLDLINVAIGLPAVPNYKNINTKVTHKIDENNELNSLLLVGIDNYIQKSDLTKSDKSDWVTEDIRSIGSEYLLGLNWKHIYQKNGFSNLYFSVLSNNFRVKVNQALKNDKLLYDNISNENQWSLKYENSFYLGNQFELNSGITIKQLNLNYNIFSPADTSANQIPIPPLQVDLKKQNYKSDLFVQVVYKATHELNLTLGGRINYFDALDKKFSFDPRFGASFQLNPVLKLNASIGVFHQAPELIWIYGNTISNTQLTYLQAVHTVLGFDYFIDSDLKLTVEGYYKKYSDYPVSVSDPTISLANLGSDYNSPATDYLTSQGKGQSYGFDFFLHKKLSDHLYGMVSYSFTKTQHKALDGIVRNGAFDIPHVFTISGGYRINEVWEISTKFRYVSGRPRTPIDVVTSKLLNRLVYDYSKINTERYPDYFRWDIRYDHRSYFKNFTLISFMEIENITNRKNPFQYHWNQATQEVTTEYQWLFFPVGGFKIEF